jgi:Secretion system C-terminal sorting domain
MKKSYFVALLLPFLCVAQSSPSSSLVAGFRASRVLQSYPNHQFPSADYWISVGNRMSQKFSGASPVGIWIVSLYQNNNITQFNFPSDGKQYPYIQFISSDQNEAYLSRFDSAGVKVWLQVEPGAAGMDTLIDLVLNRYKQHSCVRGFGIDVEWFYAATNSGGRKLTDSMAQRWEQKVKSIDSTYTLFLKHYAQSWMPPSYRGAILFVDDSQEFTSGLPQMVSEFKSWGSKFAPNKVAFQFGYPIDSTWWRQYADPPKAIGDALLANVPNTYGLFWVDFTVVRVFPVLPVREAAPVLPDELSLEQNYPNPFNPATDLRFTIAELRFVTLKIYDVLGRETSILVSEKLKPGSYSVKWNAGNLPSGAYLCRLQVDNMAKVIKLVLVK